MKNLKPLLIALTIGTATLTTQAAEPTTIQAPKQVAGYYHHQIGNTQITALLDGTNYLNPSMFKGLSDSEKSDILKKYAAKNDKGIQTSVNAFLVNTGKSLVLVDSGAASCFGAHLGSVLTNLKASGY